MFRGKREREKDTLLPCVSKRTDCCCPHHRDYRGDVGRTALIWLQRGCWSAFAQGTIFSSSLLVVLIPWRCVLVQPKLHNIREQIPAHTALRISESKIKAASHGIMRHHHWAQGLSRHLTDCVLCIMTPTLPSWQRLRLLSMN